MLTPTDHHSLYAVHLARAFCSCPWYGTPREQRLIGTPGGLACDAGCDEAARIWRRRPRQRERSGPSRDAVEELRDAGREARLAGLGVDADQDQGQPEEQARETARTMRLANLTTPVPA